MQILIQELKENKSLSEDGLRKLLTRRVEAQKMISEAAREVALLRFGHGIFVRGLIEISNYCKNNCLYCGIRAGNRNVVRYRLSEEEILECCDYGYSLGLRTFVMQGGEDISFSDEWLCRIIGRIKERYPDCAVTLSLGERSSESYHLLREAGADRYLLRHETVTAEHYSRLHPSSMSLDNRLECLRTLKEEGFQTGTGIMVGSPYQTIDNIIADIKYIEQLRPEMIGIGPFIPHRDTPFADFKAGDAELTLFLISVFRLMFPDALIPATTALATLLKDGHIRGVEAGANVIMPNLSPASRRKDYNLYDNKAAFGSEAAEGLQLLDKELATAGYYIDFGKGDFCEHRIC